MSMLSTKIPKPPAGEIRSTIALKISPNLAIYLIISQAGTGDLARSDSSPQFVKRREIKMCLHIFMIERK
jgi:hypothetical protein